MRKILGKSFIILLALAIIFSSILPAIPPITAEAADTSYGIPSELTGIWQYAGQGCADDAATTWMRGNAYGVEKSYCVVDTSSSEYRKRNEKLQEDDYLKNTKICILYLPLCPYSKSYLPAFQDMAYDCNAQVVAVDITAYDSASLAPFYSVSTYGATSPIVLYIDEGGTPQGYSGVHSTSLFAEILKDAGYNPDYDADDSERYSAEQEYKKVILNETNRQRIKENLLPLSTFDSIEEVADLRAKEVNVHTSHTRPNGTLFTTALDGISAPSVWGENICAGPIVATPTAAMTGWMNSPGHRANILSESYSHIGVGYYCNTTDTSRYKDNWVQLFGGTCNVSSISVNTPQIKVTQGFPISDMDITVTLTCPVHGKTTMPLIDEMCTGYDINASGEQKVTVHYGDLTTDFIVSAGEFDPIRITPDMVTILDDEMVYTGRQLTPDVSVFNSSGEYTLLENYSYTVEYSDNINVGEGTVTVTGKGNYYGTVTKTFDILPKDLDTAYVKGINESYEYTSRPITPAVTVYSDGVMLYEGQDYTVAYSDNVGKVVAGKPGSPDTVDTTARITVTGMGNYTGTVSADFKIIGDEIFQKATQIAKRIWPNTSYGSNAYEFWQIMRDESNFSMARREVEATLTAAKEGGYFEQVMACTTYPEAARRINDYYRFCYELDHEGAEITKTSEIKSAVIAAENVSINGIESSLGGGTNDVRLAVSDAVLPVQVNPEEYDIISAVPLEIDLKINGESADLSSPVTITMNIPENLGDGSRLHVLHYKNGADKAPEILNVVLNGDGTFSFTTSSFSPFVLANKNDTYDAAQIDSADDTFGNSDDSGAPAPSDFKAVRSGVKDITVSWNGAAESEYWTVTGYEISCSVNANMSDALTVQLDADSTSYVLKDLEAGTYYIMVSTIAKSDWTSYAVSPSHVTRVVLSQLSDAEHTVIIPSHDTESKIAGHSLTLGGKIGVRFHVSLSESAAADGNAYMKFTFAGREIIDDAPIQSDGYYIYTCEVAAKEMSDEIKAELIVNGKTAAEETYSVKAYVEQIDNAAGIDDTQKSLAKAMLNYGMAAQKFFNYNADKLTGKIEGSAPTSTDYKVEGAADGITYYGSTAVLKSTTAIRHYFLLDEGADIADYSFACGDKALTPVAKDGMYYVEISDISANNLGVSFVVTVTKGGNVQSITYSPYTYAYRILAGSQDENLKILVKALHFYGEAAKAVK